jgi:hypothetical protein
LTGSNFSQSALAFNAGDPVEGIVELDRASGAAIGRRILNGIEQAQSPLGDWVETGPTPPPWNGIYDIRWDAPVAIQGINTNTASATGAGNGNQAWTTFTSDIEFSVTTSGPEYEIQWPVYLRKNNGTPEPEVPFTITITVSAAL